MQVQTWKVHEFGQNPEIYLHFCKWIGKSKRLFMAGSAGDCIIGRKILIIEQYTSQGSAIIRYRIIARCVDLTLYIRCIQVSR